MDYLKTKAPFWKKELGEGVGSWVEQRQSDIDAMSRWDE
jgi:molybdopterin synthase catalytic subunit